MVETIETGTCIDCGSVTPLRLPPRFPHICTECLFPPRPLDGEVDELNMPPLTWSDQLDMLHRAVNQSRIRFFKPFGHSPNTDWREWRDY